jgi:hypothetical protein
MRVGLQGVLVTANLGKKEQVEEEEDEAVGDCPELA